MDFSIVREQKANHKKLTCKIEIRKGQKLKKLK